MYYIVHYAGASSNAHSTEPADNVRAILMVDGQIAAAGNGILDHAGQPLSASVQGGLSGVPTVVAGASRGKRCDMNWVSLVLAKYRRIPKLGVCDAPASVAYFVMFIPLHIFSLHCFLIL